MTDSLTPPTPDQPDAGPQAPVLSDPANDLTRPQKRLLKRLYNARSVPVIADGRPFLTYREAVRHLLSLPLDTREAAYAQMKAQARDKLR